MAVFSSPVPKGCRFTSGFGMRTLGGRRALHAGADWAPPKPGQTGIPIFAVADGTVIAVGQGYGRSTDRIPYHSGKYVWIDHGVHGGDRMRSYSGHLASYSVKRGQKVKAGEQIGTMGATGNVTGIHLHLGVSQNHDRPINAAKSFGAPGWIDPKTWLESKGVRVGSDEPVTPGKASSTSTASVSGDYEHVRVPSPNYHTPAQAEDHYGQSRTIEAIVIHHWGQDGQAFNTPVDWLTRDDGTSSAHKVAEHGKVATLVDDENVAWHARQANPRTLGLELRPEAREGDYATAAKVIREWRDKHGPLPLEAHSDHNATACPGRWNLHRLDELAGGGGGVNTTHRGSGSTVTTASKPKASSGLEWPENRLYVDGDFGPVTQRAYQRLLAPSGVGNYRGWIDGDFGALSVKAEQRWLKNLGYYGRGYIIDGWRGPATIKALQRFLRDRGFYGGWIDGNFGPLSTKGLQRYLNSQRRYYI